MNDVPAPLPPPAPVKPQRIAAGWFLGFCFVGLLLFAWLRGAGRILLPVLLLIGAGVLIVRVIRAVTRPLP